MAHYRTILVHLPDAERARRVLSAAVPLALKHDAHLIGLYVMPSMVISPAFGYAEGIIAAGRKTFHKQAEAIEAIFEKSATGLQLKKDWRFVEPRGLSAVEALLAQCRAADLVMVSQRNSAWDDTLMLEFPEDVVMSSGRPTIVVPNAGDLLPIGRRITIAWNDSREAARAAFDAMPLLQGADSVRIVWVNPEDESLSPGDLPTAEIAATLARHGVKCTSAEVRGSDISAGVELLRQVAKDQSDLLVMGAYGRSKLREFIFGGATRSTFSDMRVPVLYAH
ncbi:MAG: hypothetical protein RL291_235 [Pseudomonadota bacterium]|jgi:nucleotide-binding universal stress UspA family protein